MRALSYLKNRFAYAAKGTGSLKINLNDMEALNDIINFINSKEVNTSLEDSLLLFYILAQWKIELRNSELGLTPNEGSSTIMNAHQILERLCMRIFPKEDVIRDCITDIHATQLKQGMHHTQLIPENIVREYLENVLTTVKDRFKPISLLKNIPNVKIQTPRGLTNSQKQLLGYEQD